jgi:hypothetical protein
VAQGAVAAAVCVVVGRSTVKGLGQPAHDGSVFLGTSIRHTCGDVSAACLAESGDRNSLVAVAQPCAAGVAAWMVWRGAVLPVVALLAIRRFGIVVRASIMVGVWMLVSLLLTGVDPWVSYLPFLHEYTGRADLWSVSPADWWLPTQMVNGRGVLLKLLGPGRISVANGIATVLLACVAIGVLRTGSQVRAVWLRQLQAWWVVVLVATVFVA